MLPGEFRWSAFDMNRCDYYYHNGYQVRFYRQCPERLGGAGYEQMEPRWIDYMLRFLERVKL